MNDKFIEKIIKTLQGERKLFNSEDDLKFALAWLIKKYNNDLDVRLEYCPKLLPNMHIDILVIDSKRWIPIELKYRTKELKTEVDGEIYNLTDHSAKDQGCCAYLNDIKRIEDLILAYPDKIDKGYTIFITNDLGFTKQPNLKNGKCYYREFSLENGRTLPRIMKWIKDKEGPSKSTMSKYEKGIELIANNYKINWLPYSKIENTKNGEFRYLINKIDRLEVEKWRKVN